MAASIRSADLEDLLLRAWLDQLQAHGDEQLASFERHVERRGR